MKIIRTLILSLLACILCDPSASLACTCQPPNPNKSFKQHVKKARRDAKVVFSGTAKEVIVDSQMNMLIAKFKVENYWKGAGVEEVTIETILSTCSFIFETGKGYLVYAYEFEEGRLETTICNRTQELADAGREIKILKKLAK